MVLSRSDRRRFRAAQAESEFPDSAETVLDVLELTELAWHDCFGDVTPSDDIFVVAQADLGLFVRAARLAVEDFRDLRVQADGVRT